MWLWAAWSGGWWRCPWQGVETQRSLWSFSTQAILWFCVMSMRKASILLGQRAGCSYELSLSQERTRGECGMSWLIQWRKLGVSLCYLQRPCLLGLQMAEGRCFQGPAGWFIHGTETCQHVIICVILYLEQQVTVAVVHVWSLKCQGESKASSDRSERPWNLFCRNCLLLHFPSVDTTIYCDDQTQS